MLRNGRILWAILSLLIALTALCGAEPLPEYFGVYALVGDKLTELKPLSRDCYLPGMTSGLAGTDLIRCLSYAALPQGDLRFIVYAQGAEEHMQLPVRRIARVSGQETLDFSGNRVEERKRLEGFWYPSEARETLRVAPVPSHARLMIKAVPERSLAAGVWALEVGNNLYPFAVGENPEQMSDCVIRVVHITGVKYRSCQAGNSPGRVDTPNYHESENTRAKPGPPAICLTKGSAILVPGGSYLKTVKVFKRPDALAERLGTLPSGTAVTALGKYDNTYCKVETEKGTGWVSYVDIRPAPVRNE